MTNLYELTGEMRDLRALGEMEGELVVKDTLDAIAGEFKNKAEAIVHISLNLNGDVDSIKNEIERLQDRKKAIENRDKSLKEYLRENMEAAGINKISCPLFTITLAAGRSIAIIENEAELPDEMVEVKTEIVPDKAKILAALKSGQAVAGASLGTSKSSIRIK
jgi:hypothetical protein